MLLCVTRDIFSNVEVIIFILTRLMYSQQEVREVDHHPDGC
jgi:hypothetical protein